MNLTVLSMLIYVFLMVIIIVIIGRLFFKWGKHFIENLLPKDISASINNALLVAYYLFNIGYAFIMMQNWPNLIHPVDLINIISHKIGYIIILLGVMHYINMLAIEFYQWISTPYKRKY